MSATSCSQCTYSVHQIVEDLIATIQHVRGAILPSPHAAPSKTCSGPSEETLKTALGATATPIETLKLLAGNLLTVLAEVQIAGSSATEAPSSRIAGHTPVLAELLRRIAAAAPCKEPILLLGETGTGKELAAHWIHVCSGRKGPFYAVNCAGFAETLLESEMFGHVKGAFTGATSNRAGAFKTADGGTLFLDEIGDMPLRLQIALLRAIELGVFHPVGADAVVKVDVRIVAATNKNLEEGVRAGWFRGDLLYRIGVLQVRVPPLRERREDIPDIARVIALAEDVALSPCAYRFLETLDYPGNIRGLRNLLLSARRFGGNPVTAEKLKAEIASGPSAAAPAMPRTLRAALDWVHSFLIRDALAASGGCVAKAARILKITPQALHEYLDAHPKLNGKGAAARRKRRR